MGHFPRLPTKALAAALSAAVTSLPRASGTGTGSPDAATAGLIHGVRSWWPLRTRPIAHGGCIRAEPLGVEKRPTIVVLDAEPVVRSAVVEILQHDGYEVLPTDDPDAIIQIVKSHRPALVITNVALPGISGH